MPFMTSSMNAPAFRQKSRHAPQAMRGRGRPVGFFFGPRKPDEVESESTQFDMRPISSNMRARSPIETIFIRHSRANAPTQPRQA